jgi:hypothetical protein
MGCTYSFPVEDIEKFKSPTEVRQPLGDWLPGTWELPKELYEPIKPTGNKRPANNLHWVLAYSDDDHDYYEETKWRDYRKHVYDDNDLSNHGWNYPVRLKVPKGMRPVETVLARTAVLLGGRSRWGY